MLKKRNLIFLSLLILGVFLISGCWLISTPTYTITYDGNGHTGGTVPVDPSSPYEYGATVTVLDKGDLVRTGYTFAGWDTAADGSGTDHAVGSTFTMGAADVTLYAKWATNTYTVTFNKNDTAATGTMTDQTIASGLSANLTACAFTKTGWTFAGWATTPSGTVIYADGASYTMGVANVILYAKWTPPTTYSLRDIGPAGGLIFYVKEGVYSDGWMYLKAAPSDQSTGTEWGCYGVLISGADGTAVGAGEQNTIDIEAGCATAGIAADICANLSLGGYSGWFLPSKDELNQMYVNLKVAGVGGFESDYYWSSSEFDVSLAWDQPFGTGTYIISSKNINYRVRAIRAF